MLGAGLRLFHLSAKSLWLDEILTAQAAQQRTPMGVLALVRQWDVPPLSFLLTWAVRILGDSDFLIRLPEALAGIACVPVIFALGKSLFRPRVGLLAAFLYAVLPFSVAYAQEARPYALLMFFTTLQMLLAYRMAGAWSRRASLGFAFASVANMYTHYLAFAATLAAYAYLGLALTVERLRARTVIPREDNPIRWWGPDLSNLAVAAAITATFYVPWLLPFVNCFRRPELGCGRPPVRAEAPAAQTWALLSAVSFEGPVLALFVIGLVTLVVSAVWGRWRPSLLILFWIGAPLLSFFLRAGISVVAMLPRYFSVLFPAGVIVAAVGVEAVARGAQGMMQWARGRSSPAPHGSAPGMDPRPGGLPFMTTVAYIGLTVLVLTQSVPRLEASYRAPKDDYRSAAAHILRSTRSDAVVLAVGPYSGFVVAGLEYYLAGNAARIPVLDAVRIDDRFVDRLRHASGPVWAAIFHGPPKEIPTDGFHVERFPGMTIVTRPDSGHGPIADADLLLRWAGTFHHPQDDSRSVFEALAGLKGTGENLLPAPSHGFTRSPEAVRDQWTLLPGTTLEQDTFRLAPGGSSVNVVFTTGRLRPGGTFVIQFAYRNPQLHGVQRVYVSAHHRDERWLDVFPTGGGYLCDAAQDWKTGAFGFTLPPDTASAIIWLRAVGTGTADYRDVEVRPIGQTREGRKDTRDDPPRDAAKV